MTSLGMRCTVMWLGLVAVAAAQTPPEKPAAGLIRNFTQRGAHGQLRFRILGGRLLLDHRLGGSIIIRPNKVQGGTEELEVFLGGNGRAKLAFTRTTPSERLSYEFSENGDVAIARKPLGQASFPAVEFSQSEEKGVCLALGEGGGRREFHAKNLWRLLICRPEECGEHLIPLLDLLRPDWNLAATVQQIEEKLLAAAQTDSDANRGRWAELVEQLGDDRFARREAADRALRAGGASALAYLLQLDATSLDAEQQFRVQRIIGALSGNQDDDSPDEAAAAMARDPAVWLALLARPKVETRRIAARQLASLLDGPIDVDPAADPDSQKERREAIRERIEGK